MKTTYFKKYPLIPFFFLVVIFTLVNVTSCAEETNDLTVGEQGKVTDLEVFAKDLTSNPIYLQLLYDKLETAAELQIALALKPKESADAIKNYGESIADGLEVFDNEKAIRLLDLSVEKDENLLDAATNLMGSARRFNEFLANQGLNSNEQAQVFEIISSSETNRILLSNNLIDFENYIMVPKNNARQCLRRYRWCMAGDFATMGLIAALGCTSSVAGGPAAVAACLAVDTAWFSGFAAVCAQRYFNCMGFPAPAARRR